MHDEKYSAEMAYWRDRHQKEGTLGNAHYKDLMLQVSGKDTSFFYGKKIADFGCGPRGSLEWATSFANCYCIDVLVDAYRALGIDQHAATYIACSETYIPLETGSMDAVFSINSLDHSTHWRMMLDECVRILKPGGLMAMSINIDEPPSPAEPNTLTVPDVLACLGGRIMIDRQKQSNRFKGANKYQYLIDWATKGTEPPPYNGQWGMLWFSGTKV